MQFMSEVRSLAATSRPGALFRLETEETLNAGRLALETSNMNP